MIWYTFAVCQAHKSYMAVFAVAFNSWYQIKRTIIIYKCLTVLPILINYYHLIEASLMRREVFIMALCCIELVMTPHQQKKFYNHTQSAHIDLIILFASFFYSHCNDVENVLSSILWKMYSDITNEKFICIESVLMQHDTEGSRNVKTMTLLTMPTIPMNQSSTRRTMLGRGCACVGAVSIHHYFSTQSKSLQHALFDAKICE